MGHEVWMGARMEQIPRVFGPTEADGRSGIECDDGQRERDTSVRLVFRDCVGESQNRARERHLV